MTASILPTPRRGSRAPRSGLERAAWIFMRVSGAMLVVLIFTHLFFNLILGDGISGIDFGFVAGKLANPVWQVWDLLLLWLAMIHGTNGIRVIINDYARKDRTRFVLKMFLYFSFTLIVVLGTLVIFTLDPCPIGADPSLVPSFCGGLH